MAKHIEQPGSLQSNPASIKILSKPSCSACSLTKPEPGTTMAETCSATFRPSATFAAALISSMRLLVQEPINILSILISFNGTPGSRPMYCKERSIFFRRFGSSSSAGLGTFSVIGRTSSGLVPQVTCGVILRPFNVTSISKLASSSVFSFFQDSTEDSQAKPFGDLGRPFRYSNVFSSGAISPALAPPSIVMLHIVIRPSIERERTASPENSTTQPVPPAVPIFPIIDRIISFAVTPTDNSPSTVILIFFDFVCIIVWVASTCSTSDVPIPKAKQPNAP